MVHSLYPDASIPTGMSHLSTMSLNNSLVAWLCLRHAIGSGRLHGSFKPLAHGDSDCSGNGHGRVREYRRVCATLVLCGLAGAGLNFRRGMGSEHFRMDKEQLK